MPYNEAAKKATRKYIEKNYDRFNMQMKKGLKEKYRNHAQKKGMSLNAYIIYLLEKDMEETQ